MSAATNMPAELLANIAFDRDGLIVAVAQQHDTGEILMVAWMNRAAVEQTLATGEAHYWSRSRMKLWRKGETSGQIEHVRVVRYESVEQDPITARRLRLLPRGPT